MGFNREIIPDTIRIRNRLKLFVVGTMLPAFILAAFFNLTVTYGQEADLDSWSTTRTELLEQHTEAERQEQLLIAELLDLQVKITMLQQQLAALEQNITALNQEIGVTWQRMEQLDLKLQAERAALGVSLRCYYYNGTLSYLAVVLGSNDFGEFLTRLENYKRLINYYTGLIENVAALNQEYEKQQTLLHSQKAALESARQEMQLKNAALGKSLAAREQALLAARASSAATYAKLLALEKEWTVLLPQLDYLLRVFPDLPWQKVQPDRLSFNWLLGLMTMEISPANLTKQFTAVDPDLQGLRLELEQDSLVLSYDNHGQQVYKIRGKLKPVDKKILFIPLQLDIGGVALQDDSLALLAAGYDLSFSMEQNRQGLTVRKVEIKDGKIIIVLANSPNN